MKTVFNFVLKNIKAYPFDFLKVALICVICSLFISGQFTVLYSYVRTSEINRENQYGIYDYIALCENDEAFNNLENNDSIEQLGKISVYAIGATKGLNNKYFLIGYADDNSMELNKIHTLQGDMPANTNEIAIGQSTLAIFYPNANVGDSINMQINGENNSFVISGILADYSNKQWQNVDNEYALPDVLLTKEAVNLICDKPLYSFTAVKLFSNIDKNEFYDKFTEQQNLSVVQKNHQEEASVSSFWGVDEKLFGLISLITSFTVAAFLLFNLKASKKIYDTNRTGLLKLAGFSAFDLKKLHLLKIATEILPETLIGTVLGVIVAEIVLYFVEEINCFISLPLLALSFVLSLLLLILILSAGIKKRINATVCENLDGYTQIQNTGKKSKFYSDNPIILFSVKSYMLRPNVSATSALMLLLSIVILYVGMFSSSAINYIAAHSVPSDYEVCVYDGYYDKTSYIPLRPFVGLSEEDFNMFCRCDEIEKIMPIKSISMFSTNRGNIVDMSEEDKEYYGFSEDDNLYPMSLVGTDTESLQEIVQLYCEEDTDVDKLKTGSSVIAFNRGNDMYKQGDVINLTQAIFSDNSVTTVSFSVTVIAVIDENQLVENSMEQFALAGSSLLWNELAFDAVGLPLNYKELSINVKDAEKTAKIDSLIYEITDTYEDSANVQVFRNSEEKRQLQSISDSFNWVSKISSVAFVSVAFSSMIINLNLRTKQRKKIIGALRACGLNIADYVKIAISENVIEFAVPIIIGNIISVASCMILNNSIFYVPLNNIPIKLMLVFSIAYLICTVITASVSALRFFKIPISSCIKEKE